MNKITLLASTVAIAQALGCSEGDVTTDATPPDFTLPNTGSLSATHSAYGLTNNNLEGCSDALSTCQIIYNAGALTETQNLTIKKGTGATEIVYTAKETAGDFSMDLQTECSNLAGDFKWKSEKYTVSYEKYVKTCTTKKVSSIGFTTKFPYKSTNPKAKQDHFGLGHVENDCSYTSCSLVNEADDNAWVGPNPTPVYDGATIEYQFAADWHQGKRANVRTKCTDELGNVATSDAYEVVYNTDSCFNNDLKASSDWNASWKQKDLIYGDSDEWRLVKDTWSDVLFDANQKICPIKECVAMQGWTKKVAAVEASEGVEAVAEVPAKTCDVAAPDNYEIQGMGSMSDPDIMDYALFRQPTNAAEDINICYKCTNTAGGTATQQLTVTSEDACEKMAFSDVKKKSYPGTPQFRIKHENFDMAEADTESVMTVPVFDNYIEAVHECSNTCTILDESRQPQSYTNVTLTNTDDIWRISYDTKTEAGFDNSFYIKCESSLGQKMTSQLIKVVVEPQACFANAFTMIQKDKTVYAPGEYSQWTPQFDLKHENFDMAKADTESVMTVPVFDNYLNKEAECSNTCTAMQKKDSAYVPHIYTNVTLTNTDDIWRISYDTKSEAGFDNSFYIQCKSSLGYTMTSDVIQVSVKPQSGSNAAVIIIIIIVLLVCCAVCCYYGYFVAGKPQTEEIEATAVDGNIDGKADMEAAGEVNAKAGVEVKGEFSQIPLDSARTDASGNTNAEKAN